MHTLLILLGSCLIQLGITYLLIQHGRRAKERAQDIAQHSVTLEVECMTPQDFLAKAEAKNNADFWAGIPGLVWMVVGVSIGFLRMGYAGTPPLIHRWEWLFLPIFFGGLLVSMVNIIRRSRRNAEEWGLICPLCNTSLTNFKSVVLASKCCGHCGKQVLTDTEVT